MQPSTVKELESGCWRGRIRASVLSTKQPWYVKLRGRFVVTTVGVGALVTKVEVEVDPVAVVDVALASLEASSAVVDEVDGTVVELEATLLAVLSDVPSVGSETGPGFDRLVSLFDSGDGATLLALEDVDDNGVTKTAVSVVELTAEVLLFDG